MPEQEPERLRVRQDEPPKTYPFDLQPFQREAIKCVDNHRSVVVSVPAAAGKTAIAMYVISLTESSGRHVTGQTRACHSGSIELGCISW